MARPTDADRPRRGDNEPGGKHTPTGADRAHQEISESALREPNGERAQKASEYSHLVPLFEQLASCADPGERRSLRESLITGHIPIAKHIASRFTNRGESYDDLLQVALVGLIKAVDRFDPSRGVEFLSFAVPTVMGEVRKHFRDTGWGVRMPRRLKELHLMISSATSELTQVLGRPPTPTDLAAHLNISLDDVRDGLQAAHAYRSSSLDQPQGTQEDSMPLTDSLGGEDAELESVERREALRPLLANLPQRERTILVLRFFGSMTQSQIAKRIGISQMHVSRLLSKTLRQLREELSEVEQPA